MPERADLLGQRLCDEVATGLERAGGLDAGAGLLVAVSGGADSVALLRLLLPLAQARGWRIVVGHVDHGVRPDSAADAAFVAELAARCGVSSQLERLSGLAGAGEEALREARIDALLEMARQHELAAMALGHTADDRAETVLMRLVRGTGLRGLGGIEPSSQRAGLRLVRPLLAVERESLREWLQSIRQPWREDPTNRSGDNLRGRFRHQLWPAMRRENPRVLDAVLRLADDAREDQRALDGWAEQERQRLVAAQPPGRWVHGCAGPIVRLNATQLGELPRAVRVRVVQRLFREAGGDPRGPSRERLMALERVLQRRLAGNRRLDLGDGLVAALGYQRLAVLSAAAFDPPAFELVLPERGSCELPGTGVALQLNRPVSPSSLPAGEDQALLDLDQLTLPLRVRSPRPGDRVWLPGVDGATKLSALLQNARIPLPERLTVPIIVDEAARVLWVVGIRRTRIARVHSSTTRLLALRASALEPPGWSGARPVL